jgi:hypothetical protein
VNGGDSVSAAGLGVVESVSGNSLGSLVGDELDGLDDSGDELVLDTRVLSLGVLSDEDGVDIVVGGLEALDGGAGSDVGEEGEGSSEGQVEGDVSLTDWIEQKRERRCRRLGQIHPLARRKGVIGTNWEWREDLREKSRATRAGQTRFEGSIDSKLTD